MRRCYLRPRYPRLRSKCRFRTGKFLPCQVVLPSLIHVSTGALIVRGFRCATANVGRAAEKKESRDRGPANEGDCGLFCHFSAYTIQISQTRVKVAEPSSVCIVFMGPCEQFCRDKTESNQHAEVPALFRHRTRIDMGRPDEPYIRSAESCGS